MRILHVVPTYFPATRYGGPIFAVHGLARALVARGHEVDVFTTNVDGDATSDVPLDRPLLMDGVRVHYFASQMRRIYFSSAMRVALNASRFDLVHAHSVFLWPTAAASRAARSHATPYVISPRGMLVAELIRRKSGLAKRAWIRLVERRNFAHASAIHFTSERERDDAQALGIPIPRAIVIPNGIDLPPLSDAPRDPATLLFLGRVNWKKGLERLLKALEHLPAARLIVAGSDDENYATTLPRSDRAAFVGEVRGEEKDRLLRSATMLVLPSLSENFGNVVLEAMAYGMPVVVTPEVGLANDVATEGAGIVTPGDPETLAKAIASLLADPLLRSELGRRGRALAETRFTWSAVAGQMAAAYEAIRRRAPNVDPTA